MLGGIFISTGDTVKKLLFGLSLIFAPTVFSAPALHFEKNPSPVKDHWVKTLIQGQAVGPLPSSPVMLKDGRVYFQSGDINLISDGKLQSFTYDQTECPPMNGSMGLAVTSDDQLITGFSPSSFKSTKGYPAVGMINPDTKSCKVLSRYPEGGVEFVALTVDQHDNIYYSLASGGPDSFQIFRYTTSGSDTSPSNPEVLYTIPKSMPNDIAVDSEGKVYVAWYSKTGDQFHNQVTVLNEATKTMDVYAGNGSSGTSPNGTLAIHARLGGSYGIAFDKEDNLYIAQENTASIISKVERETGRIYRFAGNGKSWHILKTSLSLHTGMNPRGISFTPSGNLLYTDIQSSDGIFSDVRLIEMNN